MDCKKRNGLKMFQISEERRTHGCPMRNRSVDDQSRAIRRSTSEWLIEGEIGNWKSAWAYVKVSYVTVVMMRVSMVEMATSCYERYMIHSITLAIICVYVIWLHYDTVTCMCCYCSYLHSLWLSETAVKPGGYETSAGTLQDIQTIKM
jgi:hypothetical protein